MAQIRSFDRFCRLSLDESGGTQVDQLDNFSFWLHRVHRVAQGDQPGSEASRIRLGPNPCNLIRRFHVALRETRLFVAILSQTRLVLDLRRWHLNLCHLKRPTQSIVLRSAEGLHRPRIRVNVAPARTRYDEETVFGVLDEGAVCHVTFKLPPEEDDNPMNQAGPTHAS
jgi:hypothetical protein